MSGRVKLSHLEQSRYRLPRIGWAVWVRVIDGRRHG